jgi:hypothetical protein
VDPGATDPVRAIWIVRWDGETIQTPLVYDPERFVPEDSLDPAARPFTWMPAKSECQAAVAQLNRALARRRSSPPV